MRRRLFIVGSGALGFPRALLGQPTPGLLLESRTHRGRRWTCCRINPLSHVLGLYGAGPDDKPLRTFARLEQKLAVQGRKLLVAMNAGMFETDGTPVGWCVAEGKTLRGPNLANGEGNFFLKPNGVFGVHAGKAFVRETAAAVATLDQVTLVTQSGPLLVLAGEIHPAFRKDSANRNIRNAVGVARDGGVWWAISEDPVSFHESATFFLQELTCPDALFLDGAISRMHAPALGRKGGSAALGPLLAVTEEMV